ncbi:MAG: hypothetical protein ACRDI2_01235, partial [Chloroflexota bacterium]
DTARFVYHLLFDATGPDQTVAFDESHDALAVVDGQPVAGFGELVRQTAPGRALLYAVLLTFTYLLLSGRRLGPPLTPADPSQTGRTMFEQVQALAGLYRRAGQLDYLRRHFAEHYRRAVARSAGLEPGDGAEQDGLAIRLRARGLAGDHAARLEDAHSQRSRARTEAQLLSAVARMDETLQALPSGRSGR